MCLVTSQYIYILLVNIIFLHFLEYFHLHFEFQCNYLKYLFIFLFATRRKIRGKLFANFVYA